MNTPTSDLLGQPLRYAVCLALGMAPAVALAKTQAGLAAYDTDWGLSGPFIDTHDIEPYRGGDGERRATVKFADEADTGNGFCVKTRAFRSHKGPTYLIAICRCLVAMELGKSVLIPEGLTT